MSLAMDVNVGVEGYVNIEGIGCTFLHVSSARLAWQVPPAAADTT